VSKLGVHSHVQAGRIRRKGVCARLLMSIVLWDRQRIIAMTQRRSRFDQDAARLAAANVDCIPTSRVFASPPLCFGPACVVVSVFLSKRWPLQLLDSLPFQLFKICCPKFRYFNRLSIFRLSRGFCRSRRPLAAALSYYYSIP
jgi:hypothetical protein